MEPYIPDHLPLKSIDWLSHIKKMSHATIAIARYDGILQGMPNPQVLLSPMQTREAVISSRIEGTQASLEEVLQYEAEVSDATEQDREKDTAIVQDIHEVLNYRQAMMHAMNSLEKRPLGINMIRDLHRILLSGVRGRYKNPGEIRHTQNWIAPPGTPMEKATFIPPEPSMIMDALSNWEEYMHSTEKNDLVQLAVLKAQFEMIHPFSDGNGRIGRMLVPLILYKKRILSSPMFYISGYLESNRDIYYERLRAVSTEKDWDSWISFFLQAVAEQASENSQKAIMILALYDKMKKQVPEITHSQYSIQTIDAIFSRPIFKSSDFAEKSGIPKGTARRLAQDLNANGILEVKRERSGRRPAIYVFSHLIDIVEKNII